MHPFSTPLKTSKNRRFSDFFKGVENGCIRNKWVNIGVKSSEQCYGCRANNMKARGEKGHDVSLAYVFKENLNSQIVNQQNLDFFLAKETSI